MKTEKEVWLFLADPKNWKRDTLISNGNGSSIPVWFFNDKKDKADKAYVERSTGAPGLCTVLRLLWLRNTISQPMYSVMWDKIRTHQKGEHGYAWNIYSRSSNYRRRKFCKDQAAKL